MGANNSSHGKGQSQDDAADVKTSYYELLGVERQAADEEIKKAYRRKALELHPDRNYGKEEEATKLFAEIQVAYEVLSDPQERAWYDSHESAILRGATDGGTEAHYEHNIRVTTTEDVTAMLGKFNGRVDFSDSPTGFFGFLRETFEKLAREEEVAGDYDGLKVPDYPSFGHKDDTYEDVVKEFYAVWAGFSTKKSFAWKDIYRYGEAPDRRVRRMMEKENKRFRDEGIKEFNEAVRTLVAFVRKRDPRYTPNTQSDAERQKAMREASAAQAARARAANAKIMEDTVPEWTKVRNEDELTESEEEDVEEEEFECVACRKIFKSEKQWEAHEKSKKHQKAVQALRRKMHKDNARLNLDEDFASSGIVTPQGEEDEDEDKDDIGEESKGDAIPKVDGLNINNSKGPESELKENNEASTETKETPASESNVSSEDDEYAPRSKVSNRLTRPSAPSDPHPDSTGEDSTSVSAGKKLGKAAQKRAKRAAKEAEAIAEDLKFKCAKCNAAFPSRTQLFQHIKDFGHAAPVAKKGPKGKGKK